MDLIPRTFRIDLREFCAGVVLRTIDSAFAGVGGFDPVDDTELPQTLSSERRRLAESYMMAIDFEDTPQVLRFLKVVGWLGTQVLGGERDKLHDLCRAAGLQVSGNVVRLQGGVSTDWLIGADGRFDRDQFSQYCERMQAGIVEDPPAAIGAAKELLEAVFKHVLREHGTTLTGREQMPELSKGALKALDLTAKGIPNAKKGAVAARKVLGSLSASVQGLVELRNLYGTGHGRDRRTGIKPRHAKLAVGAALTLATFVLETMDDRRGST